ncbi:hypothetical protein, partial [Kitasatospora sp. MBT63]
REPHPSDGRRQVLDVTADGFDHVMGELAPLLRLVHQAGEDLDDHDRAAARRYLLNVADAYRTYLAADPGAAAPG